MPWKNMVSHWRPRDGRRAAGQPDRLPACPGSPRPQAASQHNASPLLGPRSRNPNVQNTQHSAEFS
eukprot:4459091-Alexandrium_andersonii.AAC.1